MDLSPELVGAGASVLAVASAAFGRWTKARSAERRDALSTMVERVATLEGRHDELSSSLETARSELTTERIGCAEKIAVLGARVSELERENGSLREHRRAALKVVHDEEKVAAAD